MNIFFVNSDLSFLADKESKILNCVKKVILCFKTVKEVSSPGQADVILIQEKFSYKDFRYINELLNDSIISRNLNKVFTINCDDSASGFLRGLYTSIPKSRFNQGIHASVPFMEYPNELIFSANNKEVYPTFLASWRGNTKSNKVRLKMAKYLMSEPGFCLETTDSWMDHQHEEKRTYIDLMLNAKYSLCPAGWAPASFRIYESMALGKCPVILADEFVPPKGPKWSNFALFFPQKQILNLPAFLLENEHLHDLLGKRALQAWNDFFCREVIAKYYTESLFSLINSTPITSNKHEIKRWKSLMFYWSNQWTFLQKALNKAKKLT